MNGKLIGTWVEVELVSGSKWVGKLEEWDEDAIFISNGYESGHQKHKGAECTNDEAVKVLSTDLREFFVK
ncbi:MAG: hypothetical protein HON90_11250 [Halobacteriovoraceae bacterium]|nr:hypothetical protein [Halobacteriovoraceae bacterium]